MKKIYFDTNIFIYFVEQYNENEKSFLEEIINQNKIITSEITIAECFATSKNKEIKKEYEKLIYNKPKINAEKIDEEILKIAAENACAYNLKLPDAIHIATALKNQCDVMYTNDKDFKKIKEKISILYDISKSINSLKEILKLEILRIEDISKILKNVSAK